MGKIVFIKDASGSITVPDEYRSVILSKDDWDLATEIAEQSKGAVTAVSIIMKNRPDNVVYGMFEDKLVPGVIVSYDDGIKINFDNDTPKGLNMFCEEGDVAYTDSVFATRETGKKISKAESVENSSSFDVSEVLKSFFSSLATSMEKKKEEMENMTEEEKEKESRKASILIRKAKLLSRKQMFLEMAAEIDLEIKVLDKFMEKGDISDLTDDDFD